jgi:chromosome partitioning protein
LAFDRLLKEACVMPVIVIANPKGGAGKSTVSTNVAGLLAHAGHAVMLGDMDQQQSARQWLGLRPPQVPAIQGWEISEGRHARPPKGVTHLVLDTPAGMGGKALDAALSLAHKVLVPVQPSLFDIQATHAFLRKLRKHDRSGAFAVGLVGMRVRENTLSNEQLHRYFDTLEVPVVGWLRDTQNYVQLAARGLTVFDVAPSRVQRDLEQWQPLAEWINT